MHWKTTTTPLRREQVVRPSPTQVARQVSMIVLVGGIWAALLVGYLQLTEKSEAAVVATRPETTIVAVAPTSTVSPSPVPTVAPTATSAPPAAMPVEPTATATSSSTPTVAATPTSLPPTDTPAPPPESAGVSFAGDVLPILQNRCVKCHGGEETEEGLVLKTYADVLAGSFNGPVIEPGSAADSLLVEMISSGKMPKRNPRLLPAEIEMISAWINAGALDN